MVASRLRLVLIPFLLFSLLIVGFMLGDAPAGAHIEAMGMRLDTDPVAQWRPLTVGYCGLGRSLHTALSRGAHGFTHRPPAGHSHGTARGERSDLG